MAGLKIPDSVRQLATGKQTQQTVHSAQAKTFTSDSIPVDTYEHRGKDANLMRWSIGRQDNSPYQYMEFWINPSECSWKIASRIIIQKTMGGAVHHEAPLYTRFDLPVLTIAFQSGNIKPDAYGQELDIPPGLGNFYRFIHLVDEPNITTRSSEPNYINILYSSTLFKGRGLWLSGFFDENGINFADNADSPSMVTNWTANFVVFESNPPLTKLRQTFQSIGIS